MATKTFQCRLITPTAKLLDEAVTYASVPAWDGLFGVLANRAPIVAKLGLGELRLEFPDKSGSAGGERSYLVQDGFAQMVDNRLTILAGRAIPVESLNLGEAQAELSAATGKKASGETPAARQTSLEQNQRAAALAREKVRLARSAGKGI